MFTKNLGTKDPTLWGILGVSLISYGIFVIRTLGIGGFDFYLACSSCCYVDGELLALYSFETQYRRRKPASGLEK